MQWEQRVGAKTIHSVVNENLSLSKLHHEVKMRACFFNRVGIDGYLVGLDSIWFNCS